MYTQWRGEVHITFTQRNHASHLSHSYMVLVIKRISPRLSCVLQSTTNQNYINKNPTTCKIPFWGEDGDKAVVFHNGMIESNRKKKDKKREGYILGGQKRKCHITSRLVSVLLSLGRQTVAVYAIRGGMEKVNNEGIGNISHDMRTISTQWSNQLVRWKQTKKFTFSIEA